MYCTGWMTSTGRSIILPVFAFLSALAVSWILALFLGTGASATPPPQWVPGRGLANFAHNGRVTGFLIGEIACLAISALVAIFLGGFIGLIGQAAILLILTGFPLWSLCLTGLASARAGRTVVLYNALHPIGTSYTRVVKGGLSDDKAEPVYLYMTDDDWSGIATASLEDRHFFDANYRVAPGLYRAEGDNRFLQVFDSLGLWPFVVHPGNDVAMQAFSAALSENFSMKSQASRNAVTPDLKAGATIPPASGTKTHSRPAPVPAPQAAKTPPPQSEPSPETKRKRTPQKDLDSPNRTIVSADTHEDPPPPFTGGESGEESREGHGEPAVSADDYVDAHEDTPPPQGGDDPQPPASQAFPDSNQPADDFVEEQTSSPEKTDPSPSSPQRNQESPGPKPLGALKITPETLRTDAPKRTRRSKDTPKRPKSGSVKKITPLPMPADDN